MKKLFAFSLVALGWTLMGCQEEEHGPVEIVEEFAGTYSVDVVVSPTLDFNIEGLTTNKVSPETSAAGELKAEVASDNPEHAVLTISVTGQSFGKIDATDWVFTLRALNFVEPDDTHTPTYALQSAEVGSRKLLGGGGTLTFDGARERNVKGADLTFSGHVNIPVKALTDNLSDADKKKVTDALAKNDNPTAIRTLLTVTTSKAKRK